MSNTLHKQYFLESAALWLCDSYSVVFQYVAFKDGDNTNLHAGRLLVNPKPSPNVMNFNVDVDKLKAGQIQIENLSYDEVMEIITDACNGMIKFFGESYSLIFTDRLDFYSDMIQKDRWFCPLHLSISGDRLAQNVLEFSRIDDNLRKNAIPFDGLTDLCNWLALSNPHNSPEQSKLEIEIQPPVDLIFDRSGLQNDTLTLTLNANCFSDLSLISIAVRAVPGEGLSSRLQLSSQIKWTLVDNLQESSLVTELNKAESVLVILMCAGVTVRRQWFIDPIKARNTRLVATQFFDADLKRIKAGLFEGQDSVRFEKAVAALTFLMGFTPALQVESDAPDIIVTTPAGRLILIECTVRVADTSMKLGKLVDRCQALSKHLRASGHSASVYGALVCSLPRDQIVFNDEELNQHRMLLVAKEELETAVNKLRLHENPDHLMDMVDTKFAQKNLF